MKYILMLTLALVALGTAVAVADEKPAENERPKLVDHPIKDAKAGEYLRYKTVEGKWESHFIERVLDVKDGEVLWEVAKTNEDASKDLGRVRIGWVKIPELKPLPHQRVVTDKMVVLEAGGKKLWCRHFLVEEAIDPEWPEQKRTKNVWYSNDVPCSGRVKNSLDNRIVTAWGEMTASELKRRLEAYKKEKAGKPGDRAKTR